MTRPHQRAEPRGRSGLDVALRRGRLLIDGGVTLTGDVAVAGSKTAAFPLLAATLLGTAPTPIQQVASAAPAVSDPRTEP